MKKLTALFLALAMVLSLAACSNTGSGEMDNKGGSGTSGGAGTSDTLQAKGYCVFGDEGALRWFSNRDPWVKDGQIIINQDRLDYMDCATHLYQNDQVAYALEWSAPWYASMAAPLPKISEAQSGGVWGMDKDQLISEGAAGGEGITQVFSYVMPSWGALIVRDNAEGNKGNFGVCSGPCSFFDGGTFLTVNEFSQHKEAAQKFIEFCTLNDETSQWWLEASNGDVVNNKAVLDANSDYQNPSFGNQNTYAFYLYGILFCLPFILAFLVFNIYPVFRTLQMSFMNYKGFGKETFVWFDNYVRAFKDPLFRDAFGNSFIMLMVGVQGIDKSYFEAATLDGAGRWQTFSKITMPLLRPIMLYVAVTSLIGGLQLFDLPYLLYGTKGDPGRALYTAVFYIYTTAFTNHQMGCAAALAFVLFLIIAVFCGIAFALMNKKEDD